MPNSDTPNTPPADTGNPPQFDEVVLQLQKDPAGIQKLLDEKRGANGEAKNLELELLKKDLCKHSELGKNLQGQWWGR